jgi:hypothetical protein
VCVCVQVSLSSELETRFGTLDSVLDMVLRALQSAAHCDRPDTAPAPPAAAASASAEGGDAGAGAGGDSEADGKGGSGGGASGGGAGCGGSSPLLPASSCGLLSALAFLLDSCAKWPAIELVCSARARTH